MWILFLLLLQVGSIPCSPPEIPKTPPSLVVQIVDPAWLPIPGVEVTVQPVESAGAPQLGRTDPEGYARFWLPASAAYSVQARPSYGFKRSRTKMWLGKWSPPSPTAYLQLRLKLSGPGVTVY